jgi:uncharacterized protein YjbI with pentapeptide repeats
MADQQHLDILKQGVDFWNKWREEYQNIEPDLSETDLRRTDLSKANFSKTNFSGTDFFKADLRETDLRKANLSGVDLSETNLFRAYLFQANLFRADLHEADLRNADLRESDLSGANLSEAHLSAADLTKAFLKSTNLSFALIGGVNFSEAILYRANLGGTELNHAKFHKADLSYANLRNTLLYQADLSEAYLSGADLGYAILTRANLSGADLMGANLTDTNLTRANLTGCHIYGISAWDVQLKDAIQSNLVITLAGEPTITVDNLKVAQFIYLLLNNEEIRDVIDTITSKVVLILGRFTSERKAVLDTIRDELRKRNYSPVLFDFEKPANRDITETVSTLAHMARFVVADITEPKSIPQELQGIIPHLPSVPVQPLLQVSEREYGMFEHFVSYPWVLPVYRYCDVSDLLHSIQEHIIDPAEKKVGELTREKAKRLEKL